MARTSRSTRFRCYLAGGRPAGGHAGVSRLPGPAGPRADPRCRGSGPARLRRAVEGVGWRVGVLRPRVAWTRRRPCLPADGRPVRATSPPRRCAGEPGGEFARDLAGCCPRWSTVHAWVPAATRRWPGWASTTAYPCSPSPTAPSPTSTQPPPQRRISAGSRPAWRSPRLEHAPGRRLPTRRAGRPDRLDLQDPDRASRRLILSAGQRRRSRRPCRRPAQSRSSSHRLVTQGRLRRSLC